MTILDDCRCITLQHSFSRWARVGPAKHRFETLKSIPEEKMCSYKRETNPDAIMALQHLPTAWTLVFVQLRDCGGLGKWCTGNASRGFRIGIAQATKVADDPC
jgi:hypothetical protein